MKYCPKCKTEYENWVKLCADCAVDLVNKLPPESKEDEKLIKWKELLNTYNSGDLSFIQSLLDANEITYYVAGENFLVMRPAVQPARVMVDEKLYDEARELLKDFKGRFTSYSTE